MTLITSLLVSLSFLELPSKLTVSSLVFPPLIGETRKLELKTSKVENLFILTGKKNKKDTALLVPGHVPHPFKTCHIELYYIELLLRVLSLLKSGQFRAVLGAIAGDNMRSRLRYGHAKCSYRNHRIKNVIYNRFSVFQGTKMYHQNWAICQKNFTLTHF